MKPSKTAALLLTCCLALSGCETTKRVVESLKTPPERLECSPAGTRPSIPAEHVIDWTRVVTVTEARTEHEAFVTRLRQREGPITAYIVDIEGKLFTCFNNMQWRRELEAGLP